MSAGSQVVSDSQPPKRCLQKLKFYSLCWATETDEFLYLYTSKMWRWLNGFSWHQTQLCKVNQLLLEKSSLNKESHSMRFIYIWYVLILHYNNHKYNKCFCNTTSLLLEFLMESLLFCIKHAEKSLPPGYMPIGSCVLLHFA